MQRHLALSAALLLAACGGSNTKKLVILHTNDEHSHMLGAGPESDDFPAPTVAGSGTIKGGAARRAVMLAAERAKAKAGGADVLTVSAGDNAMGTLEQLAFSTVGADFRLMKLLGYDVTTLGNHEFDYGPKALAAAMVAARGSSEGLPVIVASNINFSGGAGDADLAAQFDDGHADATKPLHRSWVLTTPGGLKVGFIGVMGANAASLAPAKAPVTFSVGGQGETDFPASLAKLYGDLQMVTTALRTVDKVDLVVALSHSGVDLTTPDLGEDALIAKNVSGIDVIVSGHSHTDYKGQIVTNPATGRPVMVQQAGRFGDHIGRISLSVGGGKVTFDTAATDILAVDDTTVGDTAIAGFVSGVIDGVEKNGLGGTLSLIFGALITDDPSVVGDLAFKPVAKSSFTVDNSTWQKETPLLRLSADAYLKTVEALVAPSDLAVQAAGVLRAELQPNKKGEISFSDLFRAEPLGVSPVTGTVGYPLTRFAIFLAEIKAAFEVTAALAYTSETNGDFYLVPSGMCFEYDTSRAPYDPNGSVTDPNNGRVTKISQATDHNKLDTCDKVLFDLAGYKASPLSLYTVTTNLYVATFAYVAGVKLKDPADPTKNITPAQAVVFRKPPVPANTEIKEWEALGGYLRALSPAGGTGDLPAAYKKDAPITRAICKAGSLCK